MTHTYNILPFYLWMRFTEFIREFVGCLSYYLNVICNSMKENLIILKALTGHIPSIVERIVDGLHHMLEPPLVFNLLSHK